MKKEVQNDTKTRQKARKNDIKKDMKFWRLFRELRVNPGSGGDPGTHTDLSSENNIEGR